MALLTATSVVAAGTTVTAAPAGTSNTVSASDIGVNGAILTVINGSASSITVTISDPGLTPAGNAGTTAAVTVGATSEKQFRLSQSHVDLSTQVATITLSSATTVTYKLIRC